MPESGLLTQRLANQHLSRSDFETPEEVVQWFGAVQAQDYGAAKWAVGLRTAGRTDAEIEQAFANGTILRTHVLRPTWHFVMPADIRWMLELTAPRIHAQSKSYYRKLELTDAVLNASRRVIAKALEGGKQLTRSELGTALAQAGIPTADLLRLTYLIVAAELEGLICSGARRGKQFTYALLAERAPAAKPLPREEALGMLTRRYFDAHGPATLADFVWWSGLSATDAKQGIELGKGYLSREMMLGHAHWIGKTVPPKRTAGAVYLLPNYDEYIVGYTQRAPLVDAVAHDKLDARGNVLFNHTIVIDGKILGTWKRTEHKNGISLVLNPFQPLTTTQQNQLATAARKYARFLGVPLLL